MFVFLFIVLIFFQNWTHVRTINRQSILHGLIRTGWVYISTDQFWLEKVMVQWLFSLSIWQPSTQYLDPHVHCTLWNLISELRDTSWNTEGGGSTKGSTGGGDYKISGSFCRGGGGSQNPHGFNTVGGKGSQNPCGWGGSQYPRVGGSQNPCFGGISKSTQWWGGS